jgi:hypothetical protein
VEAAALRSLGVGALMPLAALGNPLAQLLDLAPDLSVLDEVLGRTSVSGSVRRWSGARPASAEQRPGTPTISSNMTAAARSKSAPAARTARASGVAAAGSSPGVGAAARQAAGQGATLASHTTSNGIGTAIGSAIGSAIGNLAGKAPGNAAGAHGQQASTTPPRRPAPGELTPGEARAAGSTNALRRAAQTGTRPGQPTNGPAAPGIGSATARTLAPGTGSTTARAMAPSDPTPTSAPTFASASSLPVLATGNPTRGGLAELLARWQDGEPPGPEPDASAATTPEPAPAFTPALSIAQQERPLRLGDEDRIELALAQILRREVERHGLEGGR